MIKGWSDKETRKLFEGRPSKVPTEIQKRALSKLQTLNAASSLETMGKIPGNRLEALGGGRKGQHSIRVNVQYRVCFRWESGDAYEVEVVDYHE
ncbi:MAG: type II toxin-antitoxin system RelE/ParE family toxin [Gemmatimonadota bacterium]|jgi:proteic killer suppression protein|nr:type II toxin-antitoxin system RelE/ParE family toxin [Gemmatimonadota bacterium]